MLKSIAPETNTHQKRLQDYYIHEALTYIEQNFQNDITVEDIAKPADSTAVILEKCLKTLLENPTTIFNDIPHDKSNRIAKIDQTLYQRYWQCCRVPKPITFFQSI